MTPSFGSRDKGTGDNCDKGIALEERAGSLRSDLPKALSVGISP